MTDLKSNTTRGGRRKRWHAPRVPGAGLAVGVIEPNYGIERVTYGLRSGAFDHSLARGLSLGRFDRGSNYYRMTPFVLARGYDLIHAWNSTPRNGAFVTSIEMEFPRLFGEVSPARFAYVLDRVASDDCRGLWALSEAAKRYVTRTFARMGRPELAGKLGVFRGGIAERPAAPDFERARDSGAPVRILFVGGDGLRKGLYPLVAAAGRVVKAGGHLHLTIVGAFNTRTYTTPGITFDRPHIEKSAHEAPWITLHEALPNTQVRALMDTHDVLAFPTIDESLGWVPMEAAMSGLPTIATNAFALPEFVRAGETGWVAPIELDEDLRWRHTGVGGAEGREAFLAAEASIEADLVRILSGIIDAPETLMQYGRAAYALAQERYHPDVAAARLAALYAQAIG